MDGVLTVVERQRRGSHWVARAPARNDRGHVRFVLADIVGRRPRGADVLPFDVGRASPCLAGLSDPNGGPYRLAFPDNVIEATLARFHDDRTGRISARERHPLACERIRNCDCNERKRERKRSENTPHDTTPAPSRYPKRFHVDAKFVKCCRTCVVLR